MKLNENQKKKAPRYKNPIYYRLDFIKENTLNTLWSIRMTRSRVWLVSTGCIAAGLALLWVCIAFTPLRSLLPGALRGDLRAQYIESSQLLDSLENAARLNDAYIANIIRIMDGNIDDQKSEEVNTLELPDSVLAASDAERQFVRSYEDEERFNLSVLAPIAAEGMVFTTPVGATASVAPSPGFNGITIYSGIATPVSAIYRGTVVSSTIDAKGLTTLTIQHPNDFISIYRGLSDVFVDKGDKVSASQRLGNIPARRRVNLELWHKGSPLDPRDYIAL